MADNPLDIVGVETLAHLSRQLKAAGEQGKGFKRELGRALTAETKQTRKDMRDAILPSLPQRGGLAADVLRATRFSTSTSFGAGNVAVRIRASSKRSIRRMNATGAFRHPVFGDRETWVTQIAGPPEKGFLDRPFEKSRPELQHSVLLAIGRIRAQLTGGL